MKTKIIVLIVLFLATSINNNNKDEYKDTIEITNKEYIDLYENSSDTLECLQTLNEIDRVFKKYDIEK